MLSGNVRARNNNPNVSSGNYTVGDGRRRSITMKVYLAGPYQELDYLVDKIVPQLTDYEMISTARWLLGQHTIPQHLMKESISAQLQYIINKGLPYAAEDLEDIAHSDALILYNPSQYANAGHGGRHFELGYAYAMGIPSYIVGERTNIFHTLDIETYSSWSEALEIGKRDYENYKHLQLI